MSIAKHNIEEEDGHQKEMIILKLKIKEKIIGKRKKDKNKKNV